MMNCVKKKSIWEKKAKIIKWKETFIALFLSLSREELIETLYKIVDLLADYFFKIRIHHEMESSTNIIWKSSVIKGVISKTLLNSKGITIEKSTNVD